MFKISQSILIILLVLIVSVATAVTGVKWYNDDDGVPKPHSLKKPTARIDEAIGVMNKGQLCNLTMNYGQISDTRLEDPGNSPSDDFYNFRYPKTKPYGSMCDDFALMFAVEKNSKNNNNGNVIDGYTNNNNEDWVAKDGSLGATHYDGNGDTEQLLYVDGSTPYLAHSDLPQTWPQDATGKPFWPGYFRRDPTTGQTYEGEFPSDRDVYGVFTDDNNAGGDVIGIEIEQMAYCYGRPYAEDFQFYEFFLHNTSGDTIKDAWFGFYHDPDCGDYGQETLYTPAGYAFTDKYPTLVNRDFDGDIGAATSPNSVGRLEDMDYGVAILETPKNLGVTDFHYYLDTGPTYDQQLWPIISSKPNDPDISAFANEYFHGANSHIDDLSLITAGDWVYIISTGPFDFAPDDTLKFTIAVIVGDTDDDFLKNTEMAIQMFEKGFVGPAGPPPPNVWAVPDDEKVTVYWDNISELKPDPLSGELDFEGYKVYRSEDNGVTWGDEITNSLGNVIGYVPIAQFDLENSIQGVDPVNSSNYLGDNTGLKYMFVDSTVHNGIAYSYTVTAYDRGDPTTTIPSYEAAKGVGVSEKNFVTVTPQPKPAAYVSPEIYSFDQVYGKGKGDISIRIVDIQSYLDYKSENNYTSDPIFKIKFEGFPATAFTVYDSTLNDTVIAQSLAVNKTILPVISDIGVTITAESNKKIGGVKSVTDETGKAVNGVNNPDNTNSWYVSAAEIPTSTVDVKSNDYEVRFTSNGSIAYSKSLSPVALMQVPFEVWRIHPDTVQIICEYDDVNHNLTFEEKEFIYIVNVPYPASPPNVGDSISVNFPADFPIQFTFNKVAPDSTNPAGGHLPSEGQKLVVNCYSSFSDGSSFQPGSYESTGDVILFSIKEPSINEKRVADYIDDIRVVPNPYIVTSLFDPKENVRSLKFMYLPDKCDITIYSLSGVKVKEIKHTGGGIENWNLTNDFGQDIAFGVYVYVVKANDGSKKIGKLAVIK